MPEGGSGREERVELVEALVEGLWRGCRQVVKAWTLKRGRLAGCLFCIYITIDYNRRMAGAPVESTSKDQIVINAQLVKAFSEVALIDEPTGLVDYY